MPNQGPSTAIILHNLGGPTCEEEMRPFLQNLFSDPEIFRMPGFLQKPFARILSKRRAPKAWRNYMAMGGGSPVLPWTEAQGRGILFGLREYGMEGNCICLPAMRYARPNIDDALQSARKAGVQQLLSFSLYPQYSVTTTGSSENELSRALARISWDVPVLKISRWADDPGYISCLAWRLKRALRKIPPELTERSLVLYVAHGTPMSFVRRGDPYLSEVRACMGLVEAEARHGFPHRLAFQSRVGPVAWTKPYLDQVLRDLPGEGIHSVVLAPLSFVSDHVETLYELDIQMRALAEQSGIQSFIRSESLNADPDFVATLARLAANALGAKVST